MLLHVISYYLKCNTLTNILYICICICYIIYYTNIDTPYVVDYANPPTPYAPRPQDTKYIDVLQGVHEAQVSYTVGGKEIVHKYSFEFDGRYAFQILFAWDNDKLVMRKVIDFSEYRIVGEY